MWGCLCLSWYPLFGGLSVEAARKTDALCFLGGQHLKASHVSTPAAALAQAGGLRAETANSGSCFEARSALLPPPPSRRGLRCDMSHTTNGGGGFPFTLYTNRGFNSKSKPPINPPIGGDLSIPMVQAGETARCMARGWSQCITLRFPNRF